MTRLSDDRLFHPPFQDLAPGPKELAATERHHAACVHSSKLSTLNEEQGSACLYEMFENFRFDRDTIGRDIVDDEYGHYGDEPRPTGITRDAIGYVITTWIRTSILDWAMETVEPYADRISDKNRTEAASLAKRYRLGDDYVDVIALALADDEGRTSGCFDPVTNEAVSENVEAEIEALAARDECNDFYHARTQHGRVA